MTDFFSCAVPLFSARGWFSSGFFNFHYFGNLPPEIRDKIWHFAFQEAHRRSRGRYVAVYGDSEQEEFLGPRGSRKKDEFKKVRAGGLEFWKIDEGFRYIQPRGQPAAPVNLLLSCREAKNYFDHILRKQAALFPETESLTKMGISLELDTFEFFATDHTFQHANWPAFIQEIRHIQLGQGCHMEFVLDLTWNLATRSPDVVGMDLRGLLLGPFGGSESKPQTCELVTAEPKPEEDMQELESFVLESDSVQVADAPRIHDPMSFQQRTIRNRKRSLQEHLARLREIGYPVWTEAEKLAWWRELGTFWREASDFPSGYTEEYWQPR
ncbi:hypothetical protein GE09DRAFT_1232101 [Coniochaeta sp. 2T2.1]|nr:hypothetical protein GE09DRAFT_1232101 [Coniochaeta sp. 2T2.1]